MLRWGRTLFMPGVLAVSMLWTATPSIAARLGDPTVKFQIDDGATVSDTVDLLVKTTADDDAGVDKVEFTIDNELRFSDTSTPYSYAWDTLKEKEGIHKVAATVIDGKGRSSKATITVTIDNGLSKGADALADTALESLKANDQVTAEKFARRSLSLEPTNLKAARTLAGLLAKRGEFSRAADILTKAKMPVNELDARVDLAELLMRKAADSQTTEQFVDAAKLAVQTRKEINVILISRVQKDGDPVQVNISKGDALFASRNFVDAAKAYFKCGPVETAPLEALNRLMLAYVRAGRDLEAETFSRQLGRLKRLDATSNVVNGLLQMRRHDLTKAQEVISGPLEARNLSALLLGSALQFNSKKLRKASELSDEAMKLAPGVPEVLLTRAYTLADPIDGQKANMDALIADPLFVEGYVAHAYRIILGRDQRKYDAAILILDFAISIEPDNVSAIMAKAVCMISQKRGPEAESLLTKVLDIEKNAPDALMCMAVVQAMLDHNQKINPLILKANALDAERWGDTLLPNPADMARRVYQYRFIPALSPASIYPSSK